MKILRAIFDGLGIVCFVGLMVFVFKNREHHASIDLYFTGYDRVPVSMIVLGSMLGGSILALFFAIPEWFRLRSRLKELRGRADDTNP